MEKIQRLPDDDECINPSPYVEKYGLHDTNYDLYFPAASRVVGGCGLTTKIINPGSKACGDASPKTGGKILRRSQNESNSAPTRARNVPCRITIKLTISDFDQKIDQRAFKVSRPFERH